MLLFFFQAMNSNYMSRCKIIRSSLFIKTFFILILRQQQRKLSILGETCQYLRAEVLALNQFFLASPLRDNQFKDRILIAF